MSRLFYDPPKDSVTKAPPEPNQRLRNYLDKVASLIPGEVLAGYLFLIGSTSAIKNPTIEIVCVWLAFAAGLILTPFYLNSVAEPGKPKRNHLIISFFGFIVWAYVTTGSTLSDSLNIAYDPGVASFILGLFSIISGLIPLDNSPNTDVKVPPKP